MKFSFNGSRYFIDNLTRTFHLFVSLGTSLSVHIPFFCPFLRTSLILRFIVYQSYVFKESSSFRFSGDSFVQFCLFLSCYMPSRISPYQIFTTSENVMIELMCLNYIYICTHTHTHTHRGCIRRNLSYFERTFLSLNFSDMTKHTDIRR